MSTDTLIVLPAYNEAERIAAVIDGVRAVMRDAAIAVVDDGSSDGTGDVAAAQGATVLPLPFNMGYGVALQTGYKYAVAHAYDYLVQLKARGEKMDDYRTIWYYF